MPVGSTAGGQVPSASSAMRRCSEARAMCGGNVCWKMAGAGSREPGKNEVGELLGQVQSGFVRGRMTGDWRSARHATRYEKEGRGG